MDPTRLLIVEEYTVPSQFAAPGRTRELVEAARVAAEDVKAHGLDETLYLAVVEADLGMGGLVNANTRIYPGARFATENKRLGWRTKNEFVGAEAGHPEGSPTFSVAARIVSVEVIAPDGTVIDLVETEPGSFAFPVGASAPPVVKATGKLAFLRTEAGKDCYLLHRAGMPVGVSSRSYGVPVPHKLEASSPYAGANPGHVGVVVDVIEEQELVTYDVVPVPSAGTYVHANEECEAAWRRLAEAAHLPPAPSAAPENAAMDPITLATLEKTAPDLLRTIREAAVAAAQQANPLLARVAKLEGAAAERFANLLGLVEGGTSVPAGAPGNDALLTQVRGLVEAEVAPLRTRLTQAEETARNEKTRADNLERDLAVEKTQRAARELADKLAAKLTAEGAKVHEKLRAEVVAFVAEDIAARRVVDEAGVEAAVTRCAEMVKRVSEATAAAQPRVEGGAGGGAGTGAGQGGAGAGGGAGGGNANPNDLPAAELAVEDGANALLGAKWRESFGAALGRANPTAAAANAGTPPQR